MMNSQKRIVFLLLRDTFTFRLHKSELYTVCAIYVNPHEIGSMFANVKFHQDVNIGTLPKI